MKLFGRKAAKEERARREPAQVTELVPGVVVQLWSAFRESGEKRLDWSIGRTRIDGEGQPYRTFRPKDLPKCVKALARLSAAFAESSTVEVGTRSRLGLLSTLLLESLADFEQAEKDIEETDAAVEAAPVLKLA